MRKEEPYFYASTVLKEEPVVATAAEEFQPEFSPDGKEIAYLENRVVLKVVNLASKQTRTILPAEYNYSYADGDQNYRGARTASGSWSSSASSACSRPRSGWSRATARARSST